MADKRDRRSKPTLADRLISLSALQIALTFAVFGIFSALFLTPSANELAFRTTFAFFSEGGRSFDSTTTASVGETRSKQKLRYTERRTVLHKPDDPSCILYEDGSRAGKCYGN